MPWYYGASHPIGIAGSPCTPYVVGYTLTLAQTHEVAKRLCGPRHLAMVPEHPDVGLNHHFHEANIQEVILGFEDSGGPPYTISYLWVKGVLPSFDATKPRITIPPVDFKACPALEGVGPTKLNAPPRQRKERVQVDTANPVEPAADALAEGEDGEPLKKKPRGKRSSKPIAKPETSSAPVSRHTRSKIKAAAENTGWIGDDAFHAAALGAL
ncbi:hypothetical protein C8R46DRAFT_1037116 [Mycena filopes]|nr:hypothetical protein C8R46DRAFT_1037116 [Mycena filopes]